MKTQKPIDLKKISQGDAEVEKLTSAIQGKKSAEWTKQFTASGKSQSAPNVHR